MPLILQCYHQIDSDLIVDVMLTIIKRDLNTSAATIQVTVEREYEHEVFYWNAWMARQKILERLFGILGESFQNLPKMLLAIKDSNLGTIVT